jgi:hypothetical protein
MISGTSSPCAKFVGDFGSATETIRIIDLFALQVFAKNWTAATFDFCNAIGPSRKSGLMSFEARAMRFIPGSGCRALVVLDSI